MVGWWSWRNNVCRCSDQTIKAGGRKAVAGVNFVSSSDRKLPKLGSKTLEDGMTDSRNSDPKNDCFGSVMKFCMSDLAVQLGQPAYAQHRLIYSYLMPSSVSCRSTLGIINKIPMYAIGNFSRCVGCSPCFSSWSWALHPFTFVSLWPIVITCNTFPLISSRYFATWLGRKDTH